MVKNRVDVLVRLLFGICIFIGCAFVVTPFLTSILLSAILAVVSRPLFVRVRQMVNGRSHVAAGLMVTAMVVTILIPLFVLCASLTQQIPPVVYAIGDWYSAGMPVPAWISQIPYVGAAVTEFLGNSLDAKMVEAAVQKAIDPFSTFLLSFSLGVGNGLFQIVLVAFFSFFFYRDGDWLEHYITRVINRISGGVAEEMNQILVNTTRSVVIGVIGTAIGQGVIAGIGFAIAGVPGVVLLSFLVFILSIVPMGPPLVWIPIALWLYATGQTGMAVFLVLWGVLAVASVDNFLKPMLISRGSSLSMGLAFLGVFGGIIAFGPLGLVLGPVFLASTIALMRAWLKHGVTSEQISTVAASSSETDVKKPVAKKPTAKRKAEAV